MIGWRGEQGRIGCAKAIWPVHMPEMMRNLTRTLFAHLDRLVDVLAWLKHMIYLYIVLVWLMPMLALVAIASLIAPGVKGSELLGISSPDRILLWSLLGLLPWLRVCLYAEFANTKLAHRLHKFLYAAPVWAGAILLIVGGLLYLAGVF